MCGVPHKAVQNYIDILVDQGYKGRKFVKQMEDPRLAKGMLNGSHPTSDYPGSRLMLVVEKCQSPIIT